MHNRANSKDPVIAFRVPDYASARVVDAVEALEAAGNQLLEVKDVLYALRTARLDEAKRQDVRETADSIEKGKSRDPQTLEKEVLAKIEAEEAKLPSLRLVVDRRGNELAALIAETREDWLTSLHPVEAEAANRLSTALAVAKDAAKTIAGVRGAREWLAAFDEGRATVGLEFPFVGGNLIVDARRISVNRTPTVVELLELVASALELPVTREPVVDKSVIVNA